MFALRRIIGRRDENVRPRERLQRAFAYRRPGRILINIVRITILINLLMVGSELFTEFYSGGSHTAHAEYLFFGLHGHNVLVPWIWTAMVINVIAAILFLTPWVNRNGLILLTACILAFVGAWIEKGMGLIIPGFVPSTLHEIVEYTPSLQEWKITAGIWAFGLMIYTVGLKIAKNVFSRPMQPDQVASH